MGRTHSKIFHLERFIFWLHGFFPYHRSIHGLTLKGLFSYCFIIVKDCWYTCKNECYLSVSIAFWWWVHVFKFEYVWTFSLGVTVIAWGCFWDCAPLLREGALIDSEIFFSLSFCTFPYQLKKIPSIRVLFSVTNSITV